ncbi:MAG: hypothetical protein JWO81_2469 [Alphaproteobacteria bacterium]|nr:hypothetical protein [Alphaproteobacteria bacterium]
MRSLVLILCAGAVAAAPASARLVSPGLGVSWGKVGVSLARYRSDAIECGQRAAATDLANSDPGKALLVASRLMENDPTVGPGATVDAISGPSAGADALGGAGSSPSVMQMVGPQRQFAKAGDILENALERCLTQRGYRKFKLTSGQRHRLSKLPIGSDARHAYLHSLASNPDVLTRQAAD